MTDTNEAAIIREYWEARDAMLLAEAEATVQLAEVADAGLRAAKARLAIARRFRFPVGPCPACRGTGKGQGFR